MAKNLFFCCLIWLPLKEGEKKMNNELLLIVSVLLIYGGTLLFYKLHDLQGLYSWTVLATIAANIEVLILIEAFGMEQTLGNVMFASSFLVTDIISEVYGKNAANKAVNIGIMTSLMFIVVSQLWLLFTPSQNDWAMPSIEAIFSNTPRLMLVSFAVYAICQRLDVWLYHKWWEITDKKFKDHRKFLWVRNNGSTLISQLINTILFNVGAFGGMYDTKTLISIIGAGYLIYVVTSIVDTPFVYLARKIADSKEKK